MVYTHEQKESIVLFDYFKFSMTLMPNEDLYCKFILQSKEEALNLWRWYDTNMEAEVILERKISKSSM